MMPSSFDKDNSQKAWSLRCPDSRLPEELPDSDKTTASEANAERNDAETPIY